MSMVRLVLAVGVLLAVLVACGPSDPGPQPGFDVSLASATVTLVRGEAARSVSVTITRSGGFTGAVSLSVDGLPSGVAYQVDGGGGASSATLQFTADLAALPTTGVEVVVRGSGAGIAAAVERTLTVLVVDPAAVPGFDFVVSPAVLTLTRGGDAQASTVTITRSGGFTGAVSLSVEGLPTGVSYQVSGGGTSSNATLQLTAGVAATAAPAVNVLVRASGAGLAATVERTLTVHVVDPAPVVGFDFVVSPAALTLTRGGDPRTSEVTITRTGGFTGAVTLSVDGLPSGVSYQVDGGGLGSGATLQFSADLTAVAADAVSVVVSGSGAGVTGTVERSLSLEIANPPATVVLASDGFEGTRQVRQGFGRIEVLVEGSGLAGAANPRFEGMGQSGGPVSGEILSAGGTSVRIAFQIPAGATLGDHTLVLPTNAGILSLANAIEITPIVFAATSTGSQLGTYDRPYVGVHHISNIAQTGDEVILLEGTHPMALDTYIPDGVTVRGEGEVVLSATQDFMTGFTFNGSAEVSNLTFNGFYWALSVNQPGEVILEDITVRFGTDWGLVVWPGFPTNQHVRLTNSRFVSNNAGGIAVGDYGSLEMLGGESSGNGYLGLYVYGTDPEVELQDVRIAENGQLGPFYDGVWVSMSGGSLAMRDTLIEGNFGAGMVVTSLGAGSIDLGTASLPGNNDLQNNAGFQFSDRRPDRFEADGPIITLVGSRLNGRSDMGGLRTGIDAFVGAAGNYWEITGWFNRVLLPNSP